MVELYVFPAGAGDCILIRYGVNNGRMNNIIVDGGVNNNKANIKRLLERFDEKKEKTDIIITHVDSDHISGIIGGLRLCDKSILNNCIRNIYINTISGIDKRLQTKDDDKSDPLDMIKLRVNNGGGYSIKEAISLLDVISDKEMNGKLIDYVVAGQVINIEGAVLRIISPTQKELIELANNWRSEISQIGTTVRGYSISYPEDNCKDLFELMGENLPPADTSIYNKSSIAFVFEYDDIRILMLGDASADVCVKSWNEFYSISPIKVDVVKLSHHGSARNISDSLLDNFHTDSFIISTNGMLMNRSPQMPGKRTIARLLRKKRSDCVFLLNNYVWWETCYHGSYFTNNDLKDYINSNVLRLVALNHGSYEIRERLKVYGNWNQVFRV